LTNHDVAIHKVITTTFDIALREPHPRELNAFIAELSNTASANYHHFLTPSQYAQRFGATASTMRSLRAYLTEFGINVVSISKGHNILHASATTTEIANAFDAHVEALRLSDGILVAHLTSPATLPRAIAHDVTAVSGLTTVQPETTNAVVSHAVATPSSCSSAGSSSGTTPNSLGGYTVQQQANLYGLTNAWANGDTGVGQTIAIYELSQYSQSDVATYFACYGVTPNITVTNVDGGPTSSDNAGGSTDESTLDVEEAQVLAPGARIEVYQGTQNGSGPLDVYTQIANSDTATIATTSWGICEANSNGSAQAEQPIFEEMAAQGQTVIAAAGDSGSSDCVNSSQGTSTTALAVDDPASQPLVTGVGGLTVSNISPLNESVWNDQCTQTGCGAGGGGVSSLWSQPSWQSAPGITTTPASGGMRMVPDLSVMADPSTGFIQYYTGTNIGGCSQSCTSGWGGIGGTSIGAPLVSALVATAAQICGVSRLGFINPSLYAMASTGFNDVTTGNNDLYGVGGYNAGPGYNMASGLGSPNGTGFFAGLCSPTVSSATSTFAVTTPLSTVGVKGTTITATLRNAAGGAVADASVNVAASAPRGVVTIDDAPASESASGTANYAIASSSLGVVTFNVSSSIAQRVNIDVTYEDSTLFATTLQFRGTKPGSPSISVLEALVGGFKLSLRPPTNTGGLTILYYQYSINGGRTWISLARGARSIVVTRLAKDSIYHVIARAFNARGASLASTSRKIVTRS
jgi:subtilase family serine protease